MGESSRPTSAYITPVHTYTLPSHSHITNHTYISDFEYNVTYFEDDNDSKHNDTLYTYTDDLIGPIAEYLIFSFVLLGLCFVVYGLHSLVKTDQSSPVFVINLLLTDLIQTFAKLIQISIKFLDFSKDVTGRAIRSYMRPIYFIGVIDNICFMVCISAERYVMIAHPVWYRTNQTTRTSVIVSVTVWIISAITGICVIITRIHFEDFFELTILMFLLLPYPLVIIFLLGT